MAKQLIIKSIVTNLKGEEIREEEFTYPMNQKKVALEVFRVLCQPITEVILESDEYELPYKKGTVPAGYGGDYLSVFIEEA